MNKYQKALNYLDWHCNVVHKKQQDLLQELIDKETMSLNDYQVKSKRTLNQELTKEQTVSNMIMGILGETGEVADVIKKHYYQGHDLDIEHIKEEIGDVMFYIVNLCNVLDLDLEALLYQNHTKLMKRYPNGFNEKDSIERDTQEETKQK